MLVMYQDAFSGVVCTEARSFGECGVAVAEPLSIKELHHTGTVQNFKASSKLHSENCT